MSNIERNQNQSESTQINSIITTIIYLSLVFRGIRSVVGCFTNMFYTPLLGVLELTITIVGLTGLYFITKVKKWAFFTWVGYIVLAAIINTIKDPGNYTYIHLLVAAINIGLMLLLLQLRKNGRSAWSLLFKKQ